MPKYLVQEFRTDLFCFVATVSCKSLRYKSVTFHTIFALCTCLYGTNYV